MATIDPLSASMYSLVSCPEPLPPCPLGSRPSGDGCEPQPRASAHWSLSAHCTDKQYVVRTVTRLKGWLRAMEQVVGICLLPFAGALADNLGRKPMFIASLCCHVVFVAFLLAASLTGASNWTIAQVLLAVGFVACGASNAIYHPTASAMVADLSRASERRRGDGYAAFGVVSNLSLVVGFGAMFPVLRMRLEDYSPMWCGFLGLGVVAVLMNAWILRETCPRTPKEATGDSVQPRACSCRGAVAELTAGCKIVWRDPLLRVFFPIAAIAPMSIMSVVVLQSAYQVVALGYGNARASITGVAMPLQGVLYSMLMSPLIRRLGVNWLLVLVLIVAATGGVVAGTGAASPRREIREVCFWVGMSMVSIGKSLVDPCARTIISMRVEAHHQGNVFAFLQLVSSLFHVSLGLLWPEVFFEPRSHSWRRGAIFFATATVLAVSAICVVAMTKSTPKPVDNGSSADSSDEESESGEHHVPESSDDEKSSSAANVS
eukprot:CAMPEP_0176073006 /NCGR_PEP_ID=MMETSP0120_2-20121206/36477_1 /TAXON_ID=160619 /ORGANISM="Kryptoperidinium foliaceum, Strain CCMP 1326" /LENGTH=488 /DNA_ID=CAMNT_0017406687 /DNA_START=76 /DNA_END=1539 /DNA_ORIENTATION=+